jgi:hypothetical protein
MPTGADIGAGAARSALDEPAIRLYCDPRELHEADTGVAGQDN